MALTEKRIAKLTARGRYSDGHNLFLQITSSGSRSWIFRFERHGKERMMGLGPLHVFSLKEARERARKARQALIDGVDPLEAKRVERQALALEAAKAITFEKAARDYFAQHEGKWKNAKSRAQFISTLEAYAFDTIGRLSVAAVDTGSVLKVIEPIWRKIPVTANRLRGRIEAILDWATVRGYRTGDNPARWKGHLSEALPARNHIRKAKHHAALPFDELPQFYAALRKREGVAAKALEFTILTAARTSEIIYATWNEIDLVARTWTLPQERMKAGRIHRVPLSDLAIELLRSLPKESPFLFIGAKKGEPISNMAMATVLKRMGRGDITVHGFRSTFRTWSGERTNFAREVSEQALAHSVGDATERAYARGDLFTKRSRLMEQWANFVVSEPTYSSRKVLKLRG